MRRLFTQWKSGHIDSCNTNCHSNTIKESNSGKKKERKEEINKNIPAFPKINPESETTAAAVATTTAATSSTTTTTKSTITTLTTKTAATYKTTITMTHYFCSLTTVKLDNFVLNF